MYQTIEQAIRVARHNAKITGNERYIMYEDQEYDVCAEYDLETFYLGQNPECIVYPDGEIEH